MKQPSAPAHRAPLTRRRFVAAAATVSLAALSGCSQTGGAGGANAPSAQSGAGSGGSGGADGTKASKPEGAKTDELALLEGKDAAVYNSRVLQQAIDEANQAGGGTVRLPAGTFYFDWRGKTNEANYAILMKSNVELAGDGMESTVLMPLGDYKSTGEAPHGIDMFFYGGLATGVYLENAAFRDFAIDGSAARGSSSGYNARGKGFMFTLFKGCLWERVEVRNTDGTGFGADFPIDSTMRDCVASGCGKNATEDDAGASGFGIGVGYSADESMRIEGCASYGNTKYGFFFEHQSIFWTERAKAVKAVDFRVASCTAAGNLVNFGGNRAYDLHYTNCTSALSAPEGVDASRSLEGRTHYAFHFANHSVRISVAGAVVDQSFTDVLPVLQIDKWVSWALAHNIAQVGAAGNNRLFRPTDAVTRGEAAEFLWRYSGRPGNLPIGVNPRLSDPATDVAADTYYADAVRWLKNDGIVKTTEFRPGDFITCNELAVMVWRLGVLLEDLEFKILEQGDASKYLFYGETGVREIPQSQEESGVSDLDTAWKWFADTGIAECLSGLEASATCTRTQAIGAIWVFDQLRRGKSVTER